MYPLILYHTTNSGLVQIERICRRPIKCCDIGLFSDRVENIVIKGENAGCQHFLLFSQWFQRSFSSSRYKSGFVVRLISMFSYSCLNPESTLDLHMQKICQNQTA